MTTLWLILVGSIMLGTRKYIGVFTPGFNEYTSVFLYASEILALALVWLGYRRQLLKTDSTISKLLAIFVATAFVSAVFAPLSGLAGVSAVRIFLLVALALVGAKVITTNQLIFKKTLVVLMLAGVLQSGLALYQFSTQGPAGLRLLGESPISLTDQGTSKALVAEGRLIRGYGTFPHPNVLSAFLLLGFFAGCYLFINADRRLYADLYDTRKTIRENGKLFMVSRWLIYRAVVAVCLFIITLGLGVALSRAGWIAGGVALVVFLTASLRVAIRPTLRLLAVVVIAIGATLLLLSPFIFPRATVSINEPAVADRISYNQIAVRILKSHPLGIGAGNQVAFSVADGSYRSAGFMHAWEWQPIHNLYLLIGAELGWLGLLSFLGFLAIVVWRIAKTPASYEQVVTLALLVSLLIFGLADHFLWTLEQGRLMLWVVISLALAVPAIKHSSFNG